MIRLASMLAIEAYVDWLIGRSYIDRQSMATLHETRTDRTFSTEIDDKEATELAAA